MTEITILDGGLGQELIARSGKAPTGLWSAQMLMDMPELVQSVHADYFKAGAQVATTNSYVLLPDRLAPFGAEAQFTSLHQKACEIAVRARDAYGSGLVAGSIGPTGRSYRPDLALPEAEGAKVYAEIAQLHAPYVDFHILETMASYEQARGAAMGASTTGKPVWLSLSVDDTDGSKLRSGEALIDVLPLIDEFDLSALLINCSVPEAVSTALATIGKQSVPVGAYANGFTKITEAFKQGATVDALEAREDLTPEVYADFARNWVDAGASIVGGCCEVGPAHISELKKRFN